MKPKTKAQELGFLSRDYAVAKDKKNWLISLKKSKANKKKRKTGV